MCQLILEIAEPAKYLSLRNTPDMSYQKQFIKEWAESLSRRTNGTITYRKRTRLPLPSFKSPQPPCPAIIIRGQRDGQEQS